jgi:pimeloyl-ACP methyl ester carboxylesterase
VVLLDGIGCAGYVWRWLEPDLARCRRVIHWNYRGHGRSDKPRDLDRVTLLDCVDDLLAVLDAAGERRAVLIGHSMGVQVALETHRRAPERVAALVLVCGSYARPLDTFHDGELLRAAFPYLKQLVERFPEAARYVFRTLVPTEFALQFGRYLEVNRLLVRRSDLVRYLHDLSKVDPELFVRMLASAAVHDAEDHLPEIAVPTLVVAGEKDTFTPMRLSMRMHAAIPASEMLVLPSGSHMAPLEHPELMSLRVEKFLGSRLGEAGTATAADAAGSRVA